MDYKDTLNLPKTNFSMKADLVAREPQRLDRWQASRLYEQIQARRAGAEKFVLHDGPPFANGDVHIGNALNKILKDIIVKYQTLRGKSAPYVPGWDCHGLPIEFKVTQEMRQSGGAGAEPATIRKACEAYARKYIDIQRAQFQRLGVLGDWDNPYLTFNKEYEADELRLFADIVEKGFVYRGKKPVYWSIPCRTALAEAEVEYKDHASQSVYVKFPLVGHPNTFILIWTTTPWTLPANLAVAYNPTFSYSLIHTNGESYILSTLLLSSVSEKCGWGGYEIMRSLEAGDLSQIEYEHPFIGRTGRLFPGEFVENATGTGFVHIAPGHGLEDYGLGLQHGLPIYSPVDDEGRFTHTTDLPVDRQMPSELLGKSILEKSGQSEANKSVLELLRARARLVHQENYLHSYPHCWRSKTPVIFRAMDQWFIKVDHTLPGVANVSSQLPSGESQGVINSSRALSNTATFRELALEEINRIAWVPDWGKNRMEAAVKSRPDWCISRQRTWGVPIPAFYDGEGNPMLDAKIVRATADLVEQHGSDVWFEKSAAELWALLKPNDWAGPEAVNKSNDTLDVWMDSGSSSRSVLMRRPELRHSTPDPRLSTDVWQADVYLEGSDQHRGWFQSSLLLSLAGNGVAPFKSVLTHGFVVDADRQKISKSNQGQGGYEKPQTADAYVKKWGADILRLWVASQDYRNDIVVSEERINKVAESYRLLRNTLRYQLSNLYDFEPERHSVADDQLTGIDRWILGEFAELERQVIAAYDAYEFHVVYQRISQFAAVQLSAIYHDVVKDRCYTDAAGSQRRRSTQTALYRLVLGLSKMLAPVLAFTADEAWEFVPAKPAESVHLADWKTADFCASDADARDWKALFELRELTLPHLEQARQAKLIGKALEAKVKLTGASPLLRRAAAHREDLRELLNVSQIELAESAADEIQAVVTRAEGEKCESCWRYWTRADFSSDPQHPRICRRCLTRVKKSLAILASGAT